MTEQLGIPVWGSYVIFGLATLFSGLALGLVSTRAARSDICLYISSSYGVFSELTLLVVSSLQLLVFIADFVFPSRRFSSPDYYQSEFHVTPLHRGLFLNLVLIL